jgi:hypothetical protein
MKNTWRKNREIGEVGELVGELVEGNAVKFESMRSIDWVSVQAFAEGFG